MIEQNTVPDAKDRSIDKRIIVELNAKTFFSVPIRKQLYSQRGDIHFDF